MFNKKIRIYCFFFSLVLIICSIIFARLMGVNEKVTELLFMLFAILAHAPSLLKVSQATKFFGNSPRWVKYIEISFTFSVLLSWAVLAVTKYPNVEYILLGFIASVSVAIGYVAIRINNFLSKKLKLQTYPNPSAGLDKIKDTTNRYVYFFRVFSALASLIAIVLISWGVDTIMIGSFVILTISGFASIIVTADGARVLKNNAQLAQGMAGISLGKVEKASGHAEILLYCSDKKTAKHLRIKSLTKSIKGEGFNVAIVAREIFSVPILRKFGANYVWPVPYMTTIDSVARPNVRAVFYTHDGLKNGQFTRFNQYHHILDASTGFLSKMEKFDQALDMYDYVLAPNPEVAASWRENLPSQTAAKILTLDLRKIENDDPERNIDGEVKVGLCLTPPKHTHETASLKTKTSIRNLIERYQYEVEDDPVDLEDIKPSLFLSFASKKTDRIDPWQKQILVNIAGSEAPLISHHIGAESTTWNKSDIIIVTDYNQAISLSTKGKPLLWLGDGPAPAGIPLFDPSSDQPLHEMAALPKPDPLHFNSYHDLLDHMDNEVVK